MYGTYFGFRAQPFSLLPDANFLYLSKNHGLALARLRYGQESQALITVITGDIGCGKTILIRRFMDEISSRVTVGLITNFHNSFGDLLAWVLMAFNLDYQGQSRMDRYRTLNHFLNEEYAQGRRAVLFIDEAQNMDDGTLEELRMLSNVIVDKNQFLQLVLVGQPELRNALQRPELMQFSQRISVEYHIYPLDLEETERYIQHRLKTVDGDPQIFLPETYLLIHQHSNGVPRLINILCETALAYAHGLRRKTIDSGLLQTVIDHRERGIDYDNADFDFVQDMYEFEKPPTLGDDLGAADQSVPLDTGDSSADGGTTTIGEPPVAGGQPLTAASTSTRRRVSNVLVALLTLAASIWVLNTYIKTTTLKLEESTALQVEEELLSGWLREARGYEESGRLSGVDGESALGLYRRVLERRAGNAEALAGLSRVRVRLLEMVGTAESERQWEAARGYLQVLLEVWPEDAALQDRLESVTAGQKRAELSSPDGIESSLSKDRGEPPTIEQPVSERELLDILQKP